MCGWDELSPDWFPEYCNNTCFYIVTSVTGLPLFSYDLLDLLAKWRYQQAVPFHWSWLLYMQLSFQVSFSGVSHAIGLFPVYVFAFVVNFRFSEIILYMWEFVLCRVFLILVLYDHVYWLFYYLLYNVDYIIVEIV